MKNKLGLLGLYLAIFFLSFQLPDDPDLGIHLGVGNYILRHRMIPKTDLFSFSLPTHPYAYHSWLSALGMAWSYQQAGMFGLTLLATGIIATGVWSIFRQMAVSKASVLLILVTTAVIFSSVGVRPQALSFGFFSILVAVVFPKRDKGVKGETRGRAIWAVPLLFLLWANIHGAFTVGLLFLALFWVVELGKRLAVELAGRTKLRVRFEAMDSQALGSLLLVLVVSFLATLVNPYGLELHKSVVAIATNPINALYNLEWLPLTSRGPAQLVFAALVFGVFTLVMLFRVRVDFTRLILSVVFFFLSLVHVRTTIFFLVLFLPFVSRIVQSYQRVFPWKLWFLPLSPVGLAVVALIMAVISRSVTNVSTSFREITDPVFYASYRHDYPHGAVLYIQNHQLPRLLNFHNWGGYLVWQLPKVKLFTTSIMDIYRAPGGHYFLKDYLTMVNLQPGWRERLVAYQIEGILLPPKLPLTQMVRELPDWQVVYEDKVSVLAVRNNPEGND